MSEPNRTALVIDDDPDIAELLTVLLESHGYQVDAFSDGIQAVNVPPTYDVILLDLKMPVFDGERLVDYWGLTHPDILKKVIVLSGYSSFTQGRPLSTFANIRKPFNYEDLLRVVDACATQG